MSKILISRKLNAFYKLMLAAAFVGPFISYQVGRSQNHGGDAAGKINLDEPFSMAVIEKASGPMSDEAVVELIRGWLPNIPMTTDSVVYHERVGLYQFLVQSEVFYMNKDGSAIFKGDVFDTAMLNHDPERANLTEQFTRALAFANRQSDKFSELNSANNVSTKRGVQDLLRSIDDTGIITFNAEGVEKDVFYVFFDVTCPECKKFTPEIGDLQKMGYTVKLIVVSRNGINTTAYRHGSQLVCQSNPSAELTNYMRRGFGGFSRRCEADLSVNMDAAAILGIRGTPSTIRLSDAKLFEGLYYANELSK